MYRKYVYHDVSWYDFKKPTQEEFLEVAKTYSLDQQLIKRFLSFSSKSETFISGDAMFLSLYFPCTLKEPTIEKIEKKEVKFIIGKDFIITGRSADVRGFYDIKKKIKAIDGKSENRVSDSVLPLQQLLEEIYEHIGDDLERLHKSLLFTEKHILSSKDISKQTIYGLNKATSDYHRILQRHEETWVAFDSLCKEFFKDFDSSSSLERVMVPYELALDKSKENKRREINEDLIRQQIETRKQNIKNLQRTTFWVIGFCLLIFGVKAF